MVLLWSGGWVFGFIDEYLQAERSAEPFQVARRPSGVDLRVSASEHQRAFSPPSASAPRPIGVARPGQAAVQAAPRGDTVKARKPQMRCLRHHTGTTRERHATEFASGRNSVRLLSAGASITACVCMRIRRRTREMGVVGLKRM